MKAMDDNRATLITGIIGAASSLGSLALVTLADLEQWMRISSLAVGLIVGILTIRKLMQP